MLPASIPKLYKTFKAHQFLKFFIDTLGDLTNFHLKQYKFPLLYSTCDLISSLMLSLLLCLDREGFFS